MPERAKRVAAWTKVAFGDVVRQVKDRVDPEQAGLERYVAGEHMDTDDLRLRRWGDIGDGYLGPAFHMRFKPGHVLYGSRRTYLRKVAVADFEGITANTTYVLEPKDPNVLLPELLPFIMQTEAFNQHSVRESKGSVNPYVNFSDLAWFEFALPPIEEQHRLVRMLTGIERCIEVQVGVIERIADIREAMLASLTNPRRKARTDVRLVALEFTASLITDGDHNPPKRISAGVPHVLVKNVRDGRVDVSDCTFIAAEDYQRVKKRYLPQTNDVLIVCVGATVGRSGIVGEFTEFSTDRSLAVVRFDPMRMLPSFGHALIDSRHVQEQVKRAALGSAQPHLYLGDIRRIQVPLPVLSDQRDIAQRLDDISTGLRRVRGRLNELTQMKAHALKQVALAAA